MGTATSAMASSTRLRPAGGEPRCPSVSACRSGHRLHVHWPTSFPHSSGLAEEALEQGTDLRFVLLCRPAHFYRDRSVPTVLDFLRSPACAVVRHALGFRDAPADARWPGRRTPSRSVRAKCQGAASDDVWRLSKTCVVDRRPAGRAMYRLYSVADRGQR